MVTLDEIKDFLKKYDGPELNIMEVCGSHTEAISKNGIPAMLSPRIHLLSGPGCPVCVTPSSYIDRLLELSEEPDTVIATFGDLIRVPGSRESLADRRGGAKGSTKAGGAKDSTKAGGAQYGIEAGGAKDSTKAVGDGSDKNHPKGGAEVLMVYAPMEVIGYARENPDKNYVFAAVGFETTTPVYACLIEAIEKEGLSNIKLLTAIKTMPPVINYLMEHDAPIDGFIAPGHVSVVTGYGIFEPIAERYGIPFGVAGFSGKELLVALYGIVKNAGNGVVKNYYPSVVTREGNVSAHKLVDQYFEPADAVWRGMGNVAGSGRLLKAEYQKYDAGSSGLTEDEKKNVACSCDQVLMGKKKPYECPLYGRVCTPLSPQGACMVSTEVSCFSYFANNRED